MYNLTHTFERKTFIGGIVVVISYIANSLNEVFVVWAALMIIDYITGILCGLFKNGGFSYKKAVRGIIKKMLFLVLILVTILLEFLIDYLTTDAGIQIHVQGTVTTAMYIYLIGTEGLSIIQNLIILGIPVPAFMINLFGLIRDETGNLTKK
ncbi:MAG: phage holin family protein [Thermoclostridium sp.]|nr:phage holin family protein [Thermoclostridium sp.]